MSAPITILPANEAARMAAVARYNILDTPSDGAFDRVTAIAARRFGVPVAVISIVDHDRIWFKSHHGLDVDEVDREPGLCASAILSEGPYILEDARTDIRALTNPLVVGELGLRFYASVPLRTHDGYDLGTLCVIDFEPRQVAQDEIEDLRDLAALVMDQMELRISAREAVAERDAALEQARLLGREIDHRVMNSLQFVSSLLRMQARNSDGRNAAVQLETAAGRVEVVGRVHRHFHIEEETEWVPALPYLRRLCADISDILGVPVDVEGENGQLPTKAVQPLGLILNELVTNAAKHGARKIFVTYLQKEGSTLRVADDGPGLPEGFDLAGKSGGLGMKVINVLTKQLKGTVEAATNPSGSGACFTVRFMP